MYKQGEVIEKLNGFLSYSVIQKPEFAKSYGEYIEQMKTIVNQYFNADRSGWKIQLTELQYLLFSDLMKRKTVYEKKNISLPTNYPETYHDIRKCFGDFSNIMNTTNETFHNAWVMGVGATSGTSAVIGNSLIVEWTSYFSGRSDADLTAITSLCSWIENADTDGSVFMLYEDMGNTVKQPTTDEIAKNIFVDRHFGECIEVLNLPTHKPTYV